MNRRFSASALCLSGLLLAPPVNARILVHGHRGTRGMRPENTLPAFNEALRVGVDVIELDMGVTKDDVVVVSHDQSISPEICQWPGGTPLKDSPAIRSLTLKEVKSFDCGSLPNARFPKQVPFPGEKIPTLDEVFTLIEKSDYPAIATHDDYLIREVKALAATKRRDRKTFEFQMLYGLRRQTWHDLVADGFNMRVYVPYGEQWYPYFSRRLRERKENVFFILTNLFKR